MFTEARIATAFEDLLAAIPVPPGPPLHVLDATATPPARKRAHLRDFALAAAAVAAVAILAPVVAPGFTQSLEARWAALTRWTPPPPPPQTISSRQRADFQIVAPQGLPPDVVSRRIATVPVAVYTIATRRWSAGTYAVSFSYARRGNTTFRLIAERFDPRTGPPSKYLFDADERVNGLPVRHDQYTWRNGDQVMSAVAGEGLSAAEIRTIMHAMGGTPVAESWPPRNGSIVKQYRLP